MTNGFAPPTAIQGDTLEYPSSAPAVFGLAFPWLLAPPSYTDIPRYWSPARDWALVNSVEKESMWAAAVARTATKFAAHGYIVSDSTDSTRKVAASQELLKRANGGEGWVPFALKVVQDLLLPDNGVFIRIRRQGDETVKVRVKAQQLVSGTPRQGFAEASVTVAPSGAKITGLYHLDSLRCIRTGNLAYPLRYMPVNGMQQILRWDQVLMYADQPSPRAELFGVGRSAADRAYKTIAKLAAMEQLVYENLTGGGANKLVFLQGINDPTLQAILRSGQADAQARGLVYYLGTILGAIPSDTPISMVEVKLKELLTNFVPKDERDNGYLIYANCIGVPVQDIQPLSGQGLGTGTQTVVLQEAGQGIGIAAFIKWWEQTVSDRVLPATTELQFIDEHDMRDQKARAEVQKMRADTRKVQIDSGEISPAMARQLAVDSEDLPEELVAGDVTAGGQLSDDEKQTPEQSALTPAQLTLVQSAPTAPPVKQSERLGGPGVATATKDAGHTGVMVALYPDPAASEQIAAQDGVTEPVDDLHLTLAFLGDSSETALATNKDRLVEAVKQWATEKGQPLQGDINGLGRFFHTEDDDTNAVFVSPDVPGLPELRQSLVDWIEQSGFDYAQNHGFTPHITVAYVPKAAPTPPIRIETPVTFDHITLAWGDERFDYPLGSGIATKDAADDDAAQLLESEMGWAKRLGKAARRA